jgi:hypothetical protein
MSDGASEQPQGPVITEVQPGTRLGLSTGVSLQPPSFDTPLLLGRGKSLPVGLPGKSPQILSLTTVSQGAQIYIIHFTLAGKLTN